MALNFVERRLLSQFLATLVDEDKLDASLTELVEDATLPASFFHVPPGKDLESRLECWAKGLSPEHAIIVLEAITVADFACKALARLKALSKPAPQRAQDPFAVTTIHPRKVFLDRQLLRTRLRELAEANSPYRILIVNGPAQSGKSFCSEVIANVRSVRNCMYNISSATCDLAKTGFVDARDVIERLAIEISATHYNGAPTPSDSTSLAGRNTLVQYLFRYAEELPGTHWFVVDSVRRWGSEGWKTELINEMALRTVSEASRTDGTRLVLIDHDKPLPTTCAGVTLRVTLRTADIDLGLHLGPFLADHVPDPNLVIDILDEARTFLHNEDWLDELQDLCSRVVFGSTSHG